jgi:hypothetical protein
MSLRSALPALSRSLPTGVLGGLSLIAVTTTAQKGDAIYQPYAILVLSLALILWLNRDLTPRERFASFVGGFMLASLMLYAYLIVWVIPNALGIPILGHLWRLGFLLGVGAVLGAAATLITGRRET